MIHGSTGRRAVGCKSGIGGGVDAITDVMSGAGTFEFADQNAYVRCDSVKMGIEFVGLTRCIYGHKGNY
ncbi:MAG: hypothetical protein C4B59_15935 [Candidatus Methanogaster sp.]|uniref:Uncharacterized protein n=1 Tax=Candidatus Methanogaster sp. TaxID=3386292 RepID=A0AC61KYH1_9EURY|nr:MAG: hypothetical protein C4B59_15935 [ANME-2 cluster archaeon]